MYKPGTKTVYSDVDYMLLAFAIEAITVKGLDAFLKETFWDPMGLTHTTYNPLLNGFAANDCAATEIPAALVVALTPPAQTPVGSVLLLGCGNWYTASTLGFVAQLLYQGLQNHGTDPNNANSALLEDMAESKFALVAEGGSVPATHPLVRSGYAVL